MLVDFGVNAGFVEELFAQYLENPEAVDPAWRDFFDERTQKPARTKGPIIPENGHKNGNGNGHGALLYASEVPHAMHLPTTEGEALAQAALHARIYQLVNAYRVRGHLFAHLDPLGVPPNAPPELDLANFGLGPEDLDTLFPTVDLAGVPPQLTLREIILRLEETYCRSIGVEFTHVEDPEQRTWLQKQMESTKNRLVLGREDQLRILTKLSDAEIFEQFIHRSYEAGTKRFSLEGGESMIPLLDLMVEHAGALGVSEIVMGMAHRGRLNVLANILNKSPREIFAAFEDADAERYLGSGDVKYHLGYSTDRLTETGARVHLTMTFNPSHLEFVNPVVEGRVRAKQDRRGADDAARRAVMPLLIHGDAAFIGQGIVPETLNLSGLPGYQTGGTVHLIVNNQVGFTTNPEDSRSTRYASDITRMLKVPVIHVNGEDPEAVTHVARLAIEWRQRFGKDVVIDMYCYRRYGHNEGDEPRYTQPLMYAAIDKKPTVRQIYVKRLVELGQISESQADDIVRRRREALAQALDEVKQRGFAPVTYAMGGVWSPYYGGPEKMNPDVPTAVPADTLIGLAKKLLEYPEGFHVNPKIVPLLKARHDRLAAGDWFDWGTGEILAYATLLNEGSPVRISGQDVQRGTFSHRHAVICDSATGEYFAPLSRTCQNGARIEVYNSPLSEAGVLGFDFGYSLDYPDALVIWEAQFGDFLNGAQVIVDQFITSSEDKWHRLSGIVLFLPHGFEGQGPEHSSARIERFLQNSAEDNIQVCNLTTPAQLFHVLRRQVRRPWRKPLIISTPKSLLRVPTTSSGPHRPVSTIKDLSEGRFHRAIGDVSGLDPSNARKILLCTGKLYYELAQARDARGIRDIAIVRLEQLYPLNEEVRDVLSQYKDGTKLVWVQEEPRNYGYWYYICANLPEFLGERFPVTCVARAPSASPATGSKASHLLEQRRLIDEALA
ncbi:MAG: 2-oxoglutarate dehydrogenase E1 component [Polyangiaceae bacterium]|nr:2-oxoglutarate dehydrogenase E1 component [Polyangiaceae bacterium]